MDSRKLREISPPPPPYPYLCHSLSAPTPHTSPPGPRVGNRRIKWGWLLHVNSRNSDSTPRQIKRSIVAR